MGKEIKITNCPFGICPLETQLETHTSGYKPPEAGSYSPAADKQRDRISQETKQFQDHRYFICPQTNRNATIILEWPYFRKTAKCQTVCQAEKPTATHFSNGEAEAVPLVLTNCRRTNIEPSPDLAYEGGNIIYTGPKTPEQCYYRTGKGSKCLNYNCRFNSDVVTVYSKNESLRGQVQNPQTGEWEDY